ncbi:23S rRNA (adenine(2503)-C2)-methyltransferase, partial [Patescibacteria group bacterium]|nr:23S rRNA (adenine(2503)-C2)-methyltransferase [Patescibacteria group bacterium]
INLAFSLHAPNDQLRSQLMPVNKQYPLTEVLAAIDRYLAKKRRKVMFEYLMINQVNDQPEHADQLAKLAKGKIVTINLLPYNSTGSFQPSSHNQVRRFREILENKGLSVSQRFEFGQEIKAGCGQLATDDKEKTN